MPSVCSTANTSLLLIIGAVLTMAAGPVVAEGPSIQEFPIEVITDTPEYCMELVDRVSELVRLARAPITHEVTDLSTEGQRMCAHGQTRSGIMRLRSAVTIMEKSDGPAGR